MRKIHRTGVMRALGASATPLPWGEVITALSTGLADGQFNAPGVSKFFKLWEVNDYTTLSRHVYNTQSWLVSEDWFQTLPEEYRKVIIQAARESIALAHGMSALQAIDGWNESCKKFKECYILPAEEREKMAAIARPAWKEWIVKDFASRKVIDERLPRLRASQRRPKSIIRLTRSKFVMRAPAMPAPTLPGDPADLTPDL